MNEEQDVSVNATLDALGLDPSWRVFGANDGGKFSSVGDYDLLIRSLGQDVIVQVDEEDYSGNSFCVLKGPDGRYGFLCFGWGSCSGCDALQGCSSWEEVDLLRTQLQREIVWKDSREELWLWLQDTEVQELKWHATSKAMAPFMGAVAKALFGIKASTVMTAADAQDVQP